MHWIRGGVMPQADDSNSTSPSFSNSPEGKTFMQKVHEKNDERLSEQNIRSVKESTNTSP